MNRPAAQMQQQQPPTLEELQALQAQENGQRILRAIQLGLQFLDDDEVTAPIKYADGIVDLKWLLRNLGSGVYGINLDPNQVQIEGKAPGSKEGDGQSPGGNGGTPSV